MNNNQTALISFYLDLDETIIFWLEKDLPGVNVYKIPVSRHEISKAAEKLQKLFSRDKINWERPHYTPDSDLLWLAPIAEAFFEPVAERLLNCQTLVIAPHGELHLLPIHLFPFRDKPLALTHSITYVANLSIYAMLISRYSRQEGLSFSTSSVCFSIPSIKDKENLYQNFELAPKAFAKKTGGLFLQDLNATQEAFSRYSALSKNLYLSCHGEFDENKSIESALYISDGETLPNNVKINNNALHTLSVRDILNMKISSQLVILDACMSGQQHYSTGDEPMGFPTAFLISGVNSVIASNWMVHQNCAKFFMVSLLDNWSLDSMTLGEAMREAYAATREAFPHPFHWGVFSLFGNDRLLLN